MSRDPEDAKGATQRAEDKGRFLLSVEDVRIEQAKSLRSVPAALYLAETGILMNLPVEVKSVL